ncbi:GNAT family N-acetyltransferase [Parafannyhessea sp. LCP21S3_E6]|uniref:GNAT family N-acetyltransferase n=1 Tax=unclassified Parafannyhessea TaxID=2847323 RepID=UPI003F973495
MQERFRGCGVARALLARVESQAKERGAKKVLLNTYGFQAPGLYRHLGFQEVATVDDVLGTSWNIFLKHI